MATKLILASGSRIRASLLEAARVGIEVVPARIDEAAVKQALLAEGAPPRDIADALASLKAARVSARFPDRLVLGADQVLTADGRLFDKPADLSEARAQLSMLRGRRHELLSAAVIYENSRPVWRHVGTARLTMRAFSDTFLEEYLSQHGEELLESVGAYRLEQGGTVLFDRVDGDYFSVLGLPLLELLSYLRVRKVIPE
jgi:septum formation protein